MVFVFSELLSVDLLSISFDVIIQIIKVIRDIENTADSVFCSHGAGVNVKWNKVKEFVHLEDIKTVTELAQENYFFKLLNSAKKEGDKPAHK